MKKKSVRGELVTRGYLIDTLADFREGLIDQLDTKNRRYKDEIMTGIDKVVKELQDMREENAAGTLHLERLDETVDDHEKRITRLETPQAP